MKNVIIGMSDAALFEMAVHSALELYSGDRVKCEEYIDWYIKTKGGTEFILDYDKQAEPLSQEAGNIR